MCINIDIHFKSIEKKTHADSSNPCYESDNQAILAIFMIDFYFRTHCGFISLIVNIDQSLCVCLNIVIYFKKNKNTCIVRTQVAHLKNQSDYQFESGK